MMQKEKQVKAVVADQQAALQNLLTETQLSVADTGALFEIPEEGALGLLALGYEGLILWRAKKQLLQRQRATKN